MNSLFQIQLSLVLKIQIDHKISLVQLMAWRQAQPVLCLMMAQI